MATVHVDPTTGAPSEGYGLDLMSEAHAAIYRQACHAMEELRKAHELCHAVQFTAEMKGLVQGMSAARVSLGEAARRACEAK